MLQPTILSFLKKLNDNNNKPWFDENRKEYEKAKADFLSFTAELIHGIGSFDTSISVLQPKDCIFRINRDVRFSKNKSPYKNNMAAYFNRGGKKGNGAGYYLHIEPGKSFLAVGIWMPEAEVLSKIRQEIDYNFKDWKNIINSKSFKKFFNATIENSDTLKKAPKGYTDDNPAIHYLKLKSFVAINRFTDKEIADNSFSKTCIDTFKNGFPLLRFINESLE
jgi:uncharacterized protein (TIGR02453 family)